MPLRQAILLSTVNRQQNWLEQAEGLSTLARPSDELSGSIRLAVSMSFGFSQLMPAVHEFMQRYPKVIIDIDLQDSVTGLVEQRIDLAIRIASAPDPSLIGKPIAVCESVLVASPDYLAALLPDWKPNDMKVYALYSLRKHLLPTVRALIDFLEDYFRRNAW